ncbi:helix-turn-helix domain-containing protein [Macellibacteroides fermentans]|uniref:helix-turn-helix domain-containing protein n=1 Tax=Macellibacteroides fermentans TaxID=879969 RepID=UPI00406D1B60
MNNNLFLQQGRLIRNYRKHLGMTQMELAEKSGISLMSIGKYERGERKPKVEQRIKIANALNIDVALLSTNYVPEKASSNRTNTIALNYMVVDHFDKKPDFSQLKPFLSFLTSVGFDLAFSESPEGVYLIGGPLAIVGDESEYFVSYNDILRVKDMIADMSDKIIRLIGQQ